MCLAVPGRVVKTYHELDLLIGEVDLGGVSRRVCLEHVPEVRPDEYVLVHVGFALSGIDEDEGCRVFVILAEMDPLEELMELIDDSLEVCDGKWRGIGTIPSGGLRLRAQRRDHDAERIFEARDIETNESAVCISGEILRGLKKPHDGPAFGAEYTPDASLGATMISSEGACAAYHADGRQFEALAIG